MAHLHGSPPWLTSMISYHIAHLHDHLTARIKPYILGTFSILGTNAFGESVNATFGQSTEHKISLNRHNVHESFEQSTHDASTLTETFSVNLQHIQFP